MSVNDVKLQIRLKLIIFQYILHLIPLFTLLALAMSFTVLIALFNASSFLRYILDIADTSTWSDASPTSSNWGEPNSFPNRGGGKPKIGQFISLNDISWHR